MSIFDECSVCGRYAFLWEVAPVDDLACVSQVYATTAQAAAEKSVAAWDDGCTTDCLAYRGGEVTVLVVCLAMADQPPQEFTVRGATEPVYYARQVLPTGWDSTNTFRLPDKRSAYEVALCIVRQQPDRVVMKAVLPMSRFKAKFSLQWSTVEEVITERYPDLEKTHVREVVNQAFRVDRSRRAKAQKEAENVTSS